MRMFVSVLIPVFAATLLAGLAPAQEKSLIERAQEEAGHWPAEEYGGKPEASLRVTTWFVLAHLGDGSNMRAGPRKHVVKKAVRWLRDQQDEKGQIGLRADPAWLLDHAMATFALTETERLSTYGPVRRVAVAAAAALTEAVSRSKPAVGVEVRLWSFEVVRSLRAIERDETKAVAERLAKTLAALAECEPETVRERAASTLLDELQSEQLTERDALPDHWPEDLLADPMLTLYVTLTAYQRGGCWQEASKRLQPLVKSQIGDQQNEHHGTWDPKGEFGEENGRLGTTAIGVLVLEHFYRYCQVSFVK